MAGVPHLQEYNKFSYSHLGNLLLNGSVTVNAGTELDPVGGVVSCWKKRVHIKLK